MKQDHNHDYRYPGSRPFNDSDLDRRLFFGRDEETRYLFHSILVENLFVLFAKSGMGKTSLLNAGLMDLLRKKGFVPLKIRFNDQERSPLDTIYPGIVEAVKQRNEEVNKENKIDYDPGEMNSLWQYFKTASFWSADDKRLTPVLIFDQFEEFFIMHSQDNREEFITQLADLVRGLTPASLRKEFKSSKYFPYNGTAPKVKIIISIREDYLGHLEEMSDTIPGILKNRFRLLPLKCQNAKEAILKPAGLSEDEFIRSKGFNYAEKTVNELLEFLCERREMGKIIKVNEVEPFQLQLLCRHIEEKVRQKAGKKGSAYIVKPSDLGGKTGMEKVLRGFYENRIKVLSSVWKRRKVRKLCEKGLIFNKQRSSLQEGLIIKKYKISKALLSLLVDNRLLRCEPRVGSVFYELSHDTFVQPILESRRARKIKQAWIGVPILAIILIFTYIIGLGIIDKYESINDLSELAERLKQLGNYSEAIDTYSSILERDEKRVIHYMEICELYKRLGNYDDAIKNYEKALTSKYKKKINEEIIHYQLGQIYANHKNEPGKAIESYKKALEIDPEQAEFHIALGDAYRQQLKFEDAEEEYNKVLELDNENVAAYKGLAITYINQGKPGKAMKVYRDAVDNNIDFAYIYIDIAGEMKQRGMNDKLGELYQIAAKFEYKNAASYEKLGDAFAELKDYDRAIENYRKAVKIGGNATVYKKLAAAHINRGEPGEAIEVYRNAVKANPDYAYIYSDIASAMKKEGKVGELENLYQTASMVDTKEAAYYEQLGHAFTYLKERNRAIENYEKALELKSENSLTYTRLADLYIESGMPTKVIEIYRRALNVNTDYDYVFKNMAREMKKKKVSRKIIVRLYQAAFDAEDKKLTYFEKLGDAFDDLDEDYWAAKTFGKVTELDPGNAPAWIKQGAAYRWEENYDKAIDCYEKAMRLGYKTAYTYNLLGIAYGRTGNYKEAIKSYERALRLDPGHMTARVNLAEAKLVNGDFEEAFDMSAEQLLKKKGMSTKNKLGMRFISIASLIFQDKRPGAREELYRFIDYYKPLSNPRPGVYFISEKFINESSIPEPDKKILLKLIDILESQKKVKNEELAAFKELIDKTFKNKIGHQANFQPRKQLEKQ